MNQNLKTVGGQSFEYAGISKIIIPENVTQIGFGAFYGCPNLSEVTIEGKNVDLEGSAFTRSPVTNLKVYNDINNTEIGNLKWSDDKNTLMSENDVKFIYSNYLKGIKTYKIPDEITIWSFSLYGTDIKKLILPKSLTSFKMSDILFPTLKYVDTSENENFKCVKDDGVTLAKEEDNGNKMLVDKNNQLILYLESTSEEITIPSTIKDVGSLSLQRINPKIINFNARKIEYAATGWGLNNTQTINFGENVEYANSLFCYFATDYTLNINQNNKKYFVKDGVWYSREGSNLTLYRVIKTIKESETFEIPNSITDVNISKNVTAIGESAIRGQKKMKNVIISNTITTIGIYAFADCTELTQITIPNSVKNISNDVFSGCTNLGPNSIDMKTTKEEANKNGPTGTPWGAPQGEKVMKWANS